MNVLLRKITITLDEDINILNEKKEKGLFGIEKTIETITTEKKKYTYWIEFHVDQCRFYYGERKPIEDFNRPGFYSYQINLIHTKRGLDRSLEIISDIVKRTKIIYPDCNIDMYQIPDITLYREFDKEKTTEF